MRIAICDDETQFVENIKEKINLLYSKEVQIVTFNNPFALVTYVEDEAKGDVDIIIMDIHLGNQNGIQVAESMASTYPEIEYIFVSKDIYAVQDIFKVMPLYFLYKPIKDEYIKDALIKAFRIIDEKKSKNLRIKHTVIKLSDIYYIESDKRIINVYTRSAIYSDYKKLDEIENNLYSNFLRVHQSFIVNMDKIQSIKGGLITLYNNVTIPISRSRAKEIRATIEEYLEY